MTKLTNNLYHSKQGNRVIVINDNGLVVKFIIERSGVAGCEIRNMKKEEFKNLNLTFVENRKYRAI